MAAMQRAARCIGGLLPLAVLDGPADVATFPALPARDPGLPAAGSSGFFSG